MIKHRWPLVLIATVLGGFGAGWLGSAFGLMGKAGWFALVGLMVGFPIILALLPRPAALILGFTPTILGAIWAIRLLNQPGESAIGGFMLLILVGWITITISAVIAVGAWLDRRAQHPLV